MEAGFYCTGSQSCPHRNTGGLGNALNYDETTAKNDWTDTFLQNIFQSMKSSFVLGKKKEETKDKSKTKFNEIF